ncbi:MAG: hypothetical protein OCD76_23965 [Reichenbachiella sp.]
MSHNLDAIDFLHLTRTVTDVDIYRYKSTEGQKHLITWYRYESSYELSKSMSETAPTLHAESLEYL